MEARLCAYCKQPVSEIKEAIQDKNALIFCSAACQAAKANQPNFDAMLERIREKVMKRIREQD
jgi:hypothetical protein